MQQPFIHRSAFAFLLAAFVSAFVFAAEPTLTDDGLVPIKIKYIDKAYKRPGAKLDGYTKILFKPVGVAFSKTWNARDFGAFGLTTEEVQKIRTSLASLADETFRKTLTKGGYTFVTSADEHVLELDAQIVDLYVNAPNPDSVERKRTYVMSAGEMRLVVTLRDAVTGTTLYRTIDKKRDMETGQLEWATSAWNRIRAQRALEGWAKQLQEALDEAKQG